ncbi:MAG TPA: TIGR00282 family metallophosphoesterase [Candidatus Merdivicinus intestinavium]|nr:TIGR00282 family metallophosphoesterase [Candidatus Merdivicinus intestinavium]
MRVLMIGDVVSQPGCEFLRKVLPAFKKQELVDVVICNGENSAVGNGILPHSADYLFDSGVDVITGGNHSLRRREIQDYLDDHPNLLRPANYPGECYGQGWCRLDLGSCTLLVISLLGQVYMEPIGSPFACADAILEKETADFVLVDFHAEATGEKMALGYYLDGRVSAVAGTHTHVQTADETILPGGTAYISDLGMTGPIRSILGVKPENILRRMTTYLPTRFEVPGNVPCKLEGIVLDLDKKTGKCIKIRRIRLL